MNESTTIRTLLKAHGSAEDQLRILMRADQRFKERMADGKGRYYGGLLTDDDVDFLMKRA